MGYVSVVLRFKLIQKLLIWLVFLRLCRCGQIIDYILSFKGLGYKVELVIGFEDINFVKNFRLSLVVYF